jgi:RNA polymerase sigma factor (sigma-70 family)
MALRADDVNLGRDRVLVELFQSGDCRAFEDLYRRYFQRIYRYCLKRVGDTHEAEELAQEAFVRAYSAMPRLNGERRFYPWLSVIASRLCVDTHRRRGRMSPTEHVELGVVDGGQDEVIAEVDREILAQALARLAPRHREVLRLREEEGWSYDRIATHFNVGLGTIEALLFRARRALRREFHALAGPDSRLTSLPVIGYLVRRLFAGRDRLVALAGQAGPLVAAGAMSVVVVIGTVMGTSPGAPRPTTVKSTVTPTQEIILPAFGAAAQLSPGAPTAAATASGGGAATAPPLARATAPLGGSTAPEARDNGRDSEFKVDALGVFVGLNPPTAMEGTVPTP